MTTEKTIMMLRALFFNWLMPLGIFLLLLYKNDYLQNKRKSMGAQGRFNIRNLQQIQTLTCNLKAKVCLVSDYALDSKIKYIF